MPNRPDDALAEVAHRTPKSVLRAIAVVCDCPYDVIEGRLEQINEVAGRVPRPIPRKTIAEQRLDEIRSWLGTPEGGSVIDCAAEFVQQNSVD